MNVHRICLVAITSFFVICSPAAGQNIIMVPGYADLIKLPVPVVEGDVVDRPYRVIGEVETGVRRATVFSKDPSRAKVYRELWERGKKLGADAVIKAEFGDAKIRALSWGSREARGFAIKFLTDDEINARKPIPGTSR